MKKSIIKKFFIIIVFAVVLSGVISAVIFDIKLTDVKKKELMRVANLMAEEFDIGQDNDIQAQEFAKIVKGVRITIIKPDGTVTGDSDVDYRNMEKHNDREEIKQAESLGTSIVVRNSNTLGNKLIYAVKKTDAGYYIRIAEKYNGVLSDIISFLPAMLFSMVMSLLAAIYPAGKFSDRIAKPIVDMNQSLSGVQDGSTRLDINRYPYEELRDMAAKINMLAEDVSRHIEDLEAEKVKIEYILDHMKEGFILLDSQSKIIIINKSACRYMKSDKSVLGRDMYHLTRNLDFIKSASWALQTGKGAKKDLDYEESVIEVTFNPVVKGRGDLENGMIIIMSDVTEKRNSEMLRREFFSNAGHELKTPITSIKGSAELLCSDIPISDEQRQEMLSRIWQESERMSVLIQDILMINRLETGDISKEKEYLDLKDIISEDIDEVKTMADKNDVIINADICKAVIYANRRDIHELVSNLIVNAVKYNEKGGNVDIILKNNMGWIEFSVRNDGDVIPLSRQSRIFERFYRIDKGRSKDIGGTGLGLSIVKHVVDSLNGVIVVESSEENGTKFTVRIPDGKDENENSI